MQNGAEEAADKAGRDLVVQAADREVDVERQMQIIENLHRAGQALCITPSGSREIVPVIVKANSASIPVVIVDTRADQKALAAAGGKIATFIGSDNYEGGRSPAPFSRKPGEGKRRRARGDSRARNRRLPAPGFPRRHQSTRASRSWRRRRPTGSATRASTSFRIFCRRTPDINGLFACSDLMALGATEAIAAAGKTGKYRGGRIRCSTGGRAAIKKGTMAATEWRSFPHGWVRLRSRMPRSCCAGEKIESFTPVSIELVKLSGGGTWIDPSLFTWSLGARGGPIYSLVLRDSAETVWGRAAPP